MFYLDGAQMNVLQFFLPSNIDPRHPKTMWRTIIIHDVDLASRKVIYDFNDSYSLYNNGTLFSMIFFFAIQQI